MSAFVLVSIIPILGMLFLACTLLQFFIKWIEKNDQKWWAFPTWMTGFMATIISTFLLCIGIVMLTGKLIDWILA